MEGSQTWKYLPRKPSHHHHHHHYQAPPAVTATWPLPSLYCLRCLSRLLSPVVHQYLHCARPLRPFISKYPFYTSHYSWKIAYPRRRKSLHYIVVSTLSIKDYRASSGSPSPSTRPATDILTSPGYYEDPIASAASLRTGCHLSETTNYANKLLALISKKAQFFRKSHASRSYVQVSNR